MIEQPHSARRIDTAATVNEILAEYPAAVAVFNAFGVDACCGGDASLRDAASRDGASLDAILTALEGVVARGDDAR